MAPEILVAMVLGGAAVAMGTPIGLKAAGREPPFLADLGFASGPRGSACAWALAALLALAYAAFSIGSIPDVTRHWHSISWLKALAIVAAVTAAVLEEAIFRRLLMDALAKRGIIASPAPRKVVAIAAPIAALTLPPIRPHVPWAMPKAIAEIRICRIYLIGGRSLAPCIVAHFLIDAIIEPGLLLAAAHGFHR